MGRGAAKWEPLQVGPAAKTLGGMVAAYYDSGGRKHHYAYRNPQRAVACLAFANRLYNGFALVFEDTSMHLTFKRNDRAFRQYPQVVLVGRVDKHRLRRVQLDRLALGPGDLVLDRLEVAPVAEVPPDRPGRLRAATLGAGDSDRAGSRLMTALSCTCNDFHFEGVAKIETTRSDGS
jgi:hypothetical protein